MRGLMRDDGREMRLAGRSRLWASVAWELLDEDDALAVAAWTRRREDLCEVGRHGGGLQVRCVGRAVRGIRLGVCGE